MGDHFEFSQIKKVLAKFFINKKNSKIIVTLGLAGIVLIFLSSTFTSNPKGTQKTSSNSEIINSDKYIENLEQKIKSMAGNINGVGNVEVMITLENGVEYIYANSKKSTTDKTQDYDGGSTKKQVDKDSYEQNVILIDGQDGKEALVITEIEPKVKGVVVVCDGGDKIAVVQSLTDAITTALDISSTKVSVVKSAN